MIVGWGFLLLAAAQSADGDVPPVNFPTIVARAATVDGFIPRGWKLEARALGDLNRDRLPDAALVLRMDSARNRIAPPWDGASRFDTNPRMLVVAFARRGDGYALAAADHQLIPRLDNPNQDDPFDEVAIVGGTLRVKMHLFMNAGGWQAGGSAYTFRWQDGGFKLIGFDRDSVMRNSGQTEEVSINYLTGRKHLKSGNIGSDKQASRWVAHPRKRLIDLTQVGDGLAFDPDRR